VKRGLKLLVISAASGLLGSVAYLKAGASDDLAVLGEPKVAACPLRASFQGEAAEECYAEVARAYAASAMSMAQIFAGAPHR